MISAVVTMTRSHAAPARRVERRVWAPRANSSGGGKGMGVGEGGFVRTEAAQGAHAGVGILRPAKGASGVGCARPSARDANAAAQHVGRACATCRDFVWRRAPKLDHATTVEAPVVVALRFRRRLKLRPSTGWGSPSRHPRSSPRTLTGVRVAIHFHIQNTVPKYNHKT